MPGTTFAGLNAGELRVSPGVVIARGQIAQDPVPATVDAVVFSHPEVAEYEAWKHLVKGGSSDEAVRIYRSGRM